MVGHETPAASRSALGTRVHERPAVARDPARQPLAAADRELLNLLGLDARREPAPQRFVFLVVEEQRAARERHDVAQLRRDERHRVGHAEAAAHGLRDFVERVDLAVGERDVLEDVLAAGRFRQQADGRLRGGRVRGDARQLARRRLAGVRFGGQRRIHLDERRDDARVERLAAFLPQQADGRVEAHRLVIRPLGHQRVEVVHHRQDARAERNLLALRAGRIALAVPALVVAQDQRRDRVGKRHAADDLGADLRMDPDLLEFLLRERTRLRQDVLGHGELADVVQERGGLDALDFVLGHPERAREPGRVHLHAADVALRGLILRVDRERERLDGGQMQVRDLLHVPLLVLDAAQIDLVRPVEQVDRHRRQQRRPVAAALNDPGRGRRRQGADEVARRAPQEVLVPHADDALLRRQADGRRDEQRCCRRSTPWRRRPAASGSPRA